MRTRIFLTIQIILAITYCRAQSHLPKNVIFTKEVSSYILEDKEITTLSYKFNNKSKEPLWLWIEKNDISKLPDTDKFKKYFYYRDTPDDMNLLQIGMDGGVETFKSTIYKSFLKRIYPEKEFTIQIMTNEEMSDSVKKSVFLFLERRIVIFTEEEMTTFRNGITDMSEIVFYKPDIITISIEKLKL
jgi:hypothetical protein